MPNTPRQHRQNRGRTNGHIPQGGGHSTAFMPHLQQPTQPVISPKDSINQQVFPSFSSCYHFFSLCLVWWSFSLAAITDEFNALFSPVCGSTQISNVRLDKFCVKSLVIGFFFSMPQPIFTGLSFACLLLPTFHKCCMTTQAWFI